MVSFILLRPWLEKAGRGYAGIGGDMDITIKYMLRPVAHCKGGCSI